jgi:hypothetical protein
MPDFGRFTPSGGDPSLNEINRSDRFLDALAAQQPVYATDAGEAELMNLLSGWRDEIREKPLTVPVTPRDAVIALDAAQRSRKSSRRMLTLVGSTAAAVLCLGGFVSVVAGSEPGDSLYGLRTMIFGEQQATRDDAVMLASQQLAEVQQLVDQGQWQAAQDKLQTITTTVATVNDDSQKQALVSQWQDLTVKVEAKDAAATLPPDVPPPTFPEVVVVQTPTSSDTTSSENTSSETTPPSESTSLPTPTSPLPTPSGPLPTPSGPLPTPSGPLPTPSGPLPTPSVPLPTPTRVPQTAFPPTEEPTSVVTPTVEAPTSSVAQLPPVTTTAVIEQQEAPREVPTATIDVPTATVEVPTATVQAPPSQRQSPPVERQAPVTTIIEAPAAGSGSGSEGN